MKKVIVLAVMMPFLFQFCVKKDKSLSYKIEMIDGVKVVWNFREDTAQVFKDIDFIEDLSIGHEENDENYMFVYPADIESDTDGNIFILDYRECLIKEYDPHGHFIRQIGRRGQGPGEFQGPYSMVISHQNKIYVGDPGLNKIEEFSLDGDYHQTLKIDLSNFFSVTKNNDFIIGHRTYDEEGNGYSNVDRFDFKNNQAVPFFGQRQYWPARIMDDEFTYEFPYFIRWAIDSEDRVYACSGVKYEISVYDSLGVLLFKFRKDISPIPVSGEELKKISEILDRVPSRPEEKENPFRANLVYPVLKYISIDEKDRVWIEHYQPLWSDRVNKETIYDVFSSDGIFLFSTKIPGHVYPQLVFRNGYIYALKKDDSGFTRGVRLKVIE
jgi:hypothetical protein